MVDITTIGRGSSPGDGTGDTAYDGTGKINTNFSNLKTVVDAYEARDLGDLDGNETALGVWTFTGAGTGALTGYDARFGDVTTPDFGILQIGDSIIGRTSHTSGYNLNGAFVIQNVGGPVTGDIEVAILDSSNLMRFGLPKSGIGNATYNPRSMLIAGPAIADSDIVTVGYWQTQGIFHNLTCNTSANGADLGVQNDLEVEGQIWVDDITESTINAGVTIETVLIKDGEVDGRDIAIDGSKLDTIASGANNYTHPSDGVDPGAALTGAWVFSDIAVNTAGHVTGSATRQLTPANIGAEPADATILKEADVDDTPVNGVTSAPVSSNWAFDHAADTSAHGGPYNNYSHPNHTGDVTSTGDGATVIGNDKVTYAKMQNVVADDRILGNVNGAGGIVAELTAAQVKTMLSLEDSDILALVAPAIFNNQTGTTYTILASDNGKIITFNNAASIAVTLPDTLATNFQCTIVQVGAGVPTVTRSGTDTINGASTGVAPSAQWKGMYLSQYAAGSFLALL